MSRPHFPSTSSRGPPSPSPLFIPRQTNNQGQHLVKQPEDNDLSGKTLVSIGFHSSPSSEFSIHSSTDPSSDEPSPVLSGLGIHCNAVSPLKERPSAAHLPRVSKETLVQSPRQQHISNPSRRHKSKAPSLDELKDRPLPPLPLETRHSHSRSMGNGAQLLRPKGQETPYASYQRRVKHYALPAEPQQKHFNTIDRALERAKEEQRWVDLRPLAPVEGALREGRVRKISHGARVRSQIAIPESVDENAELQPLLHTESPVSEEAKKVEVSIVAEKTRPYYVDRKQSSLLGRAVQWLRPSWSRERLRSRSAPTLKKQFNSISESAEPATAPKKDAEKPFTPPEAPRAQPAQPCPTEPTARKPRPHRDSVTRMKRVLSALMDDRISLCLSNQSNAEDERALTQLLQRTQQQLLEGLRDMPRSRGKRNETPFLQSTTVSPIASAPSLPIHSRQRRSTHELDSKPLPRPRKGTPAPAKSSTSAHVSVMFCILQEVDNLVDLFSFALVNRAAYTALKSHELPLIKSTLWKMSPAAWELREMSEIRWDKAPYTGGQSLAATLYIRHCTMDLINHAQIKFLLYDHAHLILREDTLAAMRDGCSTRAIEIDEAIWRVWTFCHLFGNHKNRENDIMGQVRWLRGDCFVEGDEHDLPAVCATSPDPKDFNTVFFSPPRGFAAGNRGLLSETQLRDMIEIWTAMASLLDFLRDETVLARRFGVFDGLDVPVGDRRLEKQALRAWLNYILTLGPTAVLSLVPLGPRSPKESIFSRANSYGWTKWTPPLSSSLENGFFVGVVSELLSAMQTRERRNRNAQLQARI
ncbi:uncharacterized protein KD926_005151 [Aspergillus affinis]|uniref:uncharacterized protein n=1 Tax=Aspergillus affinis TaxID=1070780 RepID=UPI0022FEF44F|nr:uncharacterized protein KD926_005151 [Aspergillus affinis]KAI9034901.1 hypothetical protein KD926_005151 [Aspergillus affinis]